MMPHCYKLTISYDGTNYAGWQIQPNGLSIQEVIESKMAIVLKEEIVIKGSGRTDTGVHAKNQIAHFHYAASIVKRRFLYSINALLPDDIRIKDIEEVEDNFHARYSAFGKIYHYHIRLDPIASPFNHRYSWHMHTPIDLVKLKEASLYFLGTHDFTSFANESHKGAASTNPVRHLKRLDIIEEEGGIRLEFEGDGFLYKMVRNITGFLMQVATGKKNASDIPAILAAKDRSKAGLAAPPHGLFLVSVLYTEHESKIGF